MLKKTLESIKDQVVAIKLRGRIGRASEVLMTKLIFITLLITFITAYAAILEQYRQFIQFIGYSIVVVYTLVILCVYVLKSIKSNLQNRFYGYLFQVDEAKSYTF